VHLGEGLQFSQLKFCY